MAFYNIREYLSAMVRWKVDKRRNEREEFKSVHSGLKKTKKKKKDGNNGIPWIKKIRIE